MSLISVVSREAEGAIPLVCCEMFPKLALCFIPVIKDENIS